MILMQFLLIYLYKKICLEMFEITLSVVYVVRMPRDLPCFGKQQKSTKTCIVWP